MGLEKKKRRSREAESRLRCICLPSNLYSSQKENGNRSNQKRENVGMRVKLCECVRCVHRERCSCCLRCCCGMPGELPDVQGAGCDCGGECARSTCCWQLNAGCSTMRHAGARPRALAPVQEQFRWQNGMRRLCTAERWLRRRPSPRLACRACCWCALAHCC